MILPQQRSMQLLRDRGFIVASVEGRKYFPARRPRCRVCGQQPMISLRSDLFAFADLIAIEPWRRIVMLVQTTTQAHHADRKAKILGSAEAKYAVMAGIYVVILSWAKKQERWQVREEVLSLKDFPADTPATLGKLRKPDLRAGSTLEFRP